MANVTELNRGPDISANEIDAASVSADALEAESATIGGDDIRELAAEAFFISNNNFAPRF